MNTKDTARAFTPQVVYEKDCKDLLTERIKTSNRKKERNGNGKQNLQPPRGCSPYGLGQTIQVRVKLN